MKISLGNLCSQLLETLLRIRLGKLSWKTFSGHHKNPADEPRESTATPTAVFSFRDDMTDTARTRPRTIETKRFPCCGWLAVSTPSLRRAYYTQMLGTGAKAVTTSPFPCFRYLPQQGRNYVL